MQGRSAFPTTHATWLRTMVLDAADGASVADADAAALAGMPANRAESARAQAVRHVMERYAAPLEVFVRGSSLARLGEPAEIVHGFFASRLSDAAFLEAWAQASRARGMRLRRWLMNGILFYGQGLARDRGRAVARGASVDPGELDGREGAGATAELDFERAWALAMVREATARAEEALRGEGRADDFEIFRRHAVEGLPYAAFAREFGRSETQCAGATRLVAQRVRAQLAALLREEGVDEPELEDEVARMHRWLADSPRA